MTKSTSVQSLSTEIDEALRNLPKDGICPHCNKLVENANHWSVGFGKVYQPAHAECWLAELDGEEEVRS
jgi:hypothetical protein